MPLNETKELSQIVDETILPMEHSGGDGWSILHGDTLQIIRAFKPQVFDALITDPPYASGGWKPSEKNRTTNVGRMADTAASYFSNVEGNPVN